MGNGATEVFSLLNFVIIPLSSNFGSIGILLKFLSPMLLADLRSCSWRNFNRHEKNVTSLVKFSLALALKSKKRL